MATNTLADRYGVTDDTTWFLASARGAKAGPRLVGLIRQMASQQSVLRANTDMCMAIFQWGAAAMHATPGDHYPIEKNLVAFNQAKNTVETIHAKVFKSRIAPMPLTSGSGYLARQRAKEMGKALEGVMAANDVDAIEREMGWDYLTTDHGAGACKVIEKYDCIEIQHVPIEDVWFDAAEVRQRQPRSCYHVPRDGWDKNVAIEEFACDDDEHPGLVGTPETRRQAILKAAGKAENWRKASQFDAASRVDIYEAWHLPSGKVEEVEEEYDEEYTDEETGAKSTRKATRTVQRHDGRHVVSVDGEDGTLIDEPWDGEGGFPILLSVPRKRRRHIFGMSIMRDLIPAQREYEKLTAKIQDQNQKMGLSGLCARRGDEINVRELTAGTFSAGFLFETNEQPPTPFTLEPVAQGTYGYAESLTRNMNERHGVSTMATSSQVPAGLQNASGKALQVYEDFEDVRLSAYHQEREAFKVKLSWLIVHAARRIVARTGSYKTNFRGKHGLESIDWKQVLEEKDFEIRVFPVSELSKQPAAKFAQLSEMMDRGAITVEQFKRLFDLPDLESEMELDTADTDIIDRNMDLMVTKGRSIAVEPFDNFDLIIQRAGKFYQLCRQQEVPEPRLKLLRNYITDATNMKKQAQPPPAAPAMPPAPMPPGPPGMVPPDGPLPGMPPPIAAPPPGPPMPMPMQQAA